MPTLHAEYITILGAFARLFSKRIWEHARILLIGVIIYDYILQLLNEKIDQGRK